MKNNTSFEAKKLTRDEMKALLGGQKSLQEQCNDYANGQCGNYSQTGVGCYYSFYEDCIANATSL